MKNKRGCKPSNQHFVFLKPTSTQKPMMSHLIRIKVLHLEIPGEIRVLCRELGSKEKHVNYRKEETEQYTCLVLSVRRGSVRRDSRPLEGPPHWLGT